MGSFHGRDRCGSIVFAGGPEIPKKGMAAIRDGISYRQRVRKSMKGVFRGFHGPPLRSFLQKKATNLTTHRRSPDESRRLKNPFNLLKCNPLYESRHARRENPIMTKTQSIIGAT
jgi:hypothetical protein